MLLGASGCCWRTEPFLTVLKVILLLVEFGKFPDGTFKLAGFVTTSALNVW